jgi:hypothetical protein
MTIPLIGVPIPRDEARNHLIIARDALDATMAIKDGIVSPEVAKAIVYARGLIGACILELHDS